MGLGCGVVFVGRIGVAALEEIAEAAVFAPAVVEDGAGDGAQPGGELGFRVAGADVAGDAEVGLLEGFGGEVVIAARGGEELAEEAGAVVAMKIAPGAVVSTGERGGEGAQRRGLRLRSGQREHVG